MRTLDDYGKATHVAIKNYLEVEFDVDISAVEARKIARAMSISDTIKLSDAVENGDKAYAMRILKNKTDIDLEEGYGVRPTSQDRQANAAAQNAAKRSMPKITSPAVKRTTQLQPTAARTPPNQQAQNTQTVQQNQNLAAVNAQKADQNRRDIEMLKKLAGRK